MKKSWHSFQRYYLSFNRSDRNAITIIAVLIFIFFTGYLLLPFLVPEQQEDFSEIKKVFKEWELEQERMKTAHRLFLFPFDPNTVKPNEIDSLDLPEFVKQNILRYRNAGGIFKNDSDLLRIYGMTDSIFTIIQPFITVKSTKPIPVNPEIQAKYKSSGVQASSGKDELKHNAIRNVSENISPIELNDADSSVLVALPGIGQVFAKRIVKYRNLLGGFVKKEQLLEVYNFPLETYNKLDGLIEVDSTKIEKLRINFLNYAELIRHPYLNKEQVSGILEVREKNGPFKNLLEVQGIQAFDSESFARIRPYLNCN